MNNSKKVLLTIFAVAALGGLAAFTIFAAFSGDAPTAASSFQAGTVSLGSNASGSALYSLSNQKPGDTVTSCIKVTYTGTINADVKLFTPDTIGSLGQYANLTITPGTQTSSTFPDCSGFVADTSGDLFSGTLATFASQHNSYENGILDHPGTSTAWGQNDNVVYRVTLTLQDDNAAQGLTTGDHSFVWEARNQ